jgi:hypothetical protein
MMGWAETTVVVRFWLVAGMFVALGLGIFYGGWLQLPKLRFSGVGARPRVARGRG